MNGTKARKGTDKKNQAIDLFGHLLPHLLGPTTHCLTILLPNASYLPYPLIPNLNIEITTRVQLTLVSDYRDVFHDQ